MMDLRKLEIFTPLNSYKFIHARKNCGAEKRAKGLMLPQDFYTFYTLTRAPATARTLAQARLCGV